MPKVHVSPTTIHPAPNNAYSHAVITEGGRTVFVAGQVPFDVDGSLVGGDDIQSQSRQCFTNLRSALEAVGATAADLVKLTMFVVGYEPSYRAGIIEARNEVLAFDVPPASTLVGIQALATEEILVEVEAIAWLP